MKTASQTRTILDLLEAQHPSADTELSYRTPFELLVATILSAQSTDQRVNQVTPTLFARYPDAAALARAKIEQLERQIHATGFFRAKSKALVGMARALLDRHGGQVPADMDALTALPGVGRKTANVVLGHSLGVPGFPVDRHVLRVANRIGIAGSGNPKARIAGRNAPKAGKNSPKAGKNSPKAGKNSPKAVENDPAAVESHLCAVLPPSRWTVASDTLILHGRRICKPRPLCEICAVQLECDYGRIALRASARVPRKDARAPREVRRARR